MKCPQCGNKTVYDESNKWRPFCSERCRLIDLGEWIDEKHKINDPDGPDIPDNTH
ncbi:MAG TPA: DNA gyrase inhibitor YacG [Gammaproteobacteria bacterium]